MCPFCKSFLFNSLFLHLLILVLRWTVQFFSFFVLFLSWTAPEGICWKRPRLCYTERRKTKREDRKGAVVALYDTQPHQKTNTTNKRPIWMILLRIRAAKAGQKSLVPARQAPTSQPTKDLFPLYSLSPHFPLFQKSAEATPALHYVHWLLLLRS